MDNFYGRLNSTGKTEEEVDAIFKSITDYFPKAWLEDQTGNNPLQLLWNRSDELSTIELYSFAVAISKLRLVNEAWLKRQIKTITENKDSNTRNGAIFEINGMALVTNPDSNNTQLSPNNFPGIDGTLSMPHGKHFRMSLKNYGMSYKHKTFLAQCRQTELLIKDLLKKHKILATQIVIRATGQYPSGDDHKILHQELEKFDAKSFHNAGEHKISDNWTVQIFPMKHPTKQFLHGQESYTLIMTSPFHTNEYLNFYSKLEEACANIVQQAAAEDNNTKNFIYIHLPETISFAQCEHWIANYFQQYPEKQVSAVILYQPTMVTDLQTSKKYLQHSQKIIHRQDRFMDWSVESRAIMLDLPIGRLAADSSVKHLNIGTTQVQLTDNYVFQSGNHYFRAKKTAGNEETGNVSEIAAGVFEHTAFFPFGGKYGILFSGRHAPDDRLTIL